jgi:hypothetical protein
MKKIAAGSLAALFIAAGATPAMAQTNWDNTSSFISYAEPFGVGDTATYGQTFVAGSDNVLDDFSLYLVLGNGVPVSFKAYVYAWNGTGVSGPALYASDLRTFTSSDDPQEFAFSTGGINLTSGHQYVAFLTTSGLQDGQPEVEVDMPLADDSTISSGTMVWFNNGNDFDALTHSSWDGIDANFGDAWFKASFSPGAETGGVPEPASWAMMVGGFGLVGSAMRNRRKPTVGFG